MIIGHGTYVDPYVCLLPGLDLERPVTVRVRPQVINLLVGDGSSSYSFDRAGRLIGAFVARRNYRRGLDNRVLQKWSGPDGVRQRRWLSPDEARTLLTGVYSLADRVATAIDDPRLAVLGGGDWAALQGDAARFLRIYKPVSILPPDQYLALVIQATEGCSYNRCIFCDFYRRRSFRIKGAEELRAHIVAVREFFGPAITLRRSLFLADANALVAPMDRIQGWLDAIEETGILTGAGIYSFIGAFDVHRKSVSDWAELRARGLHRLYIGMESGETRLLQFLRKPGTVGDVIDAVTTLKQAGLAASVIVMTGIGGDRYADGHVAGTIAALNAMPLTRGDIVYFSRFVDHPGSEYSVLAEAEHIRPLTAADVAEQEVAIRTGLQPHDPNHPPLYSRYDIREFIY